MLFHPDTAAGLWGHLVMAISGEPLSQVELPAGQTGQADPARVAHHPGVPHLPGGLASTPFDGEGVRTRDMDIIRNGELMSWLLTSYSARKLGLTTTGHAGYP